MTNIDKLIRKYLDASIAYGEAQEEGNSKNVNKYANIIRKVRMELQKDYSTYIESLVPLLKHENEYVRLKVAFDLLPVLTENAKEVLVELSQKRGLISFEAEMLLQEWDNGNLKL